MEFVGWCGLGVCCCEWGWYEGGDVWDGDCGLGGGDVWVGYVGGGLLGLFRVVREVWCWWGWVFEDVVLGDCWGVGVGWWGGVLMGVVVWWSGVW